jgi:hypothetical protein
MTEYPVAGIVLIHQREDAFTIFLVEIVDDA